MQIQTIFLVVFLLISACFSFSSAIDCIMKATDPSQSVNTITVDQSGDGNFVTVQEAIDSIPPGNDQWICIHVNPGIYREKVTIPVEKQCILLEGSGYVQTKIAWDDHDKTDTSATFTALPDNFVAKDVTFQNSFNRALALDDVSNCVPAVAARIYGDKSAFHQCAFLGFQDTLWDVRGRHYFNSCYIEGAADFIWGGGQSIFEGCSINVTAGLLLSGVSAGYITAQGRQSAADPSGFVFTYCSVSGIGQAYLGRAYGPYSRVIFNRTTLDAVVVPAGWDAWHYQGYEENFMFAEAGCQGPGSDTSKRVGWERKDLDASELQEFSRDSFINQDGWLANIQHLLG